MELNPEVIITNSSIISCGWQRLTLVLFVRPKILRFDIDLSILLTAQGQSRPQSLLTSYGTCSTKTKALERTNS